MPFLCNRLNSFSAPRARSAAGWLYAMLCNQRSGSTPASPQDGSPCDPLSRCQRTCWQTPKRKFQACRRCIWPHYRSATSNLWPSACFGKPTRRFRPGSYYSSAPPSKYDLDPFTEYWPCLQDCPTFSRGVGSRPAAVSKCASRCRPPAWYPARKYPLSPRSTSGQYMRFSVLLLGRWALEFLPP